MAITFFTISYIILNILIVGISAASIYLKWPHRTAVFEQMSIFILGILGLYGIGSLLLWYTASLVEYYTMAFPFCLLLGPIFYFLILGRQGEKPKKTDTLHILPFVLSLPLYAIFVSDNDIRYQYHDLYYGILHFCAFISVLSYFTWSFLLRADSIHISSSSLLQREIRVLMPFLLVCGGLIFATSAIWKVSFYRDLHGIANIFFYLIELVLAWRLCIYMYTKTTTRQDNSYAQSLTAQSINEETLELGITAEQKREYRHNVELFIRRKGFADPNLNRDKFIEKTKIPSRHLGPFLQCCYGKGFSAFINKLRVEHAGEELSKDDFEGTIDDLGLACGFRSRASFYRNFTTEFGCSPLEYRTNNLALA